MPIECAMELAAKDRPAALSLLVTNAGPSLDNLINCSDFSSIRQLYRVTVHVLRFVDHLKRKSQTDTSNNATVSEAQDFKRCG